MQESVVENHIDIYAKKIEHLKLHIHMITLDLIIGIPKREVHLQYIVALNLTTRLKELRSRELVNNYHSVIN